MVLLAEFFQAVDSYVARVMGCDVFLFRSGTEKGVLFLAWKGLETSVKYTNAETVESTPWHGWWSVSPQQSQVFADRILVKERWTREVYMDRGGHRGNLLPTYISLGALTDLFVGMEPSGRLVTLHPLNPIGEGLEYSSDEFAGIRMKLRPPPAWTAFLRMVPGLRMLVRRRSAWRTLWSLAPGFSVRELGPMHLRCGRACRPCGYLMARSPLFGDGTSARKSVNE